MKHPDPPAASGARSGDGAQEPARASRGLALLLGLFVLLGCGYGLLVPVWEAPDEPAHYRYVLFIVENGALPDYAATPEAGQPPLYYLLASLPLGLMQRLDPASVEYYQPPSLRREAMEGGSLLLWDWGPQTYRFQPGVLLLRGLNVLVGALAVGFIYLGALKFSRENAPLALAAAALIGLAPQFLGMSASVNNEALAYLTGAILFWMLGRIATVDPHPRELALAGVFAAAVPISVKFTVVAPALAVLGAAAYGLRHHFAVPARRRGLIAALALATAAAGWLMLGTDPGARLIHELDYRLLSVRPDLLSREQLGLLQYLPTQFWGSLGWARIHLAFEFVWALSLFALAGLVFAIRVSLLPEGPAWRRGFSLAVVAAGVAMGLLAGLAMEGLGAEMLGLAMVMLGLANLRLGPSAARQQDRRLLGLAWLMLFLAAAAVFRNYLTTPRIQGRFLFPAAGPLMTLIVLGWHRAAGVRADLMALVIILVMLAANLWMWFAQVIPVFYQPFLD